MLEIVTALLILVTAGVGLVMSVINRKKVEQIHILVNDRMTNAMNRINKLIDTLNEAGIDIPKEEDD